MAVDLSEVKYKCPFCKYTGSTKKKVSEHITNSKRGSHRGNKGPDVLRERTLETESEFDFVNGKEEFNDKVEEALEMSDEEKMTKELLEEVVEASGRSKNRIWRAIKDRNIPTSIRGRNPVTHLENLSEKRTYILEQYDKHGPYELDKVGKRGNSEGDEEATERHQRVTNNVSKKYGTGAKAYEVLKKYKWLVDEYDVLSNDTSVGGHSGEVKTEGNLDEMLERVKEEDEEEEKEQEEENNEESEEVSSMTPEEEFKIIRSLINDGDEELAKKTYIQFNE